MGIKILHISANQFPALEVDHFTKKIWKELAKGADEYHVLARAKDNRLHHYQEGNLYLHLVPAITKRQWSFIITSWILFFYIRKYKITKLVAQDAIFGGFTGVLAARIFAIPIMIEIHGDIYFDFFKENTLKKKFLSRLSKYVFRNATKVRSLSSVMSELLFENVGLKNICLIPNRVDCKLFYPPKEDYLIKDEAIIISVGRFVKQKGYDFAIRVCKSLSKKYRIKLVLIGGGKLTHEYRDIIGSDTNVELIEWIEQKKLIAYLKKADIYIQPSLPYYGEAMPRTILEAMAIGLPIISTNVCAIPGILNNANSILINSNSITELEIAISKLIENPQLREQLGRTALLDAYTKYNWEDMFILYREEVQNMN
ncbi:MAG: glycosyltransferase family 4 protein [Saprospiraceae bacterium]|nr:glycosyltransferase family 4 protein [Saprospiraceae bacterium]